MTAYPAVRVLALSCSLLACASALAGCGGEASATDAGPRPDASTEATDAPSTPADVSFMTDIQPILSTSCTSSRCHSNPSTFFLGGGTTSCAMASDRRMVVPGDAAASYLVHKLEGTGICGVRMPLGRPALSAAQIAAIRTWIDEGARNN